MKNGNNTSDLLKKLLHLVFAILGLIIAAIGSVFSLLKNADWKGLSSGAKAAASGFDKAQAGNFLKAHKKPLLIGFIAVCVLMVLADSLFYTPVTPVHYDHESSGRYITTPVYSRETPCYNCKGTGWCPFCDGSGTYRNYGQAVECAACQGYGICASCDGSRVN